MREFIIRCENNKLTLEGEIVHCKDCEFCIVEEQMSRGIIPDMYCRIWESNVRTDDYCSYGERKEKVQLSQETPTNSKTETVDTITRENDPEVPKYTTEWASSSDLISRQAAIDAAIEAADDWDGGCSKEREWFIRDALEELPSAQPEPHWTPCSEELPKENGHYLVTFHQTATEEDLGFDMDDTDVCKMRYDTKHGWRTPRHIPSWINDVVVSTVLAWMPLPEPYKDGDGNG